MNLSARHQSQDCYALPIGEIFLLYNPHTRSSALVNGVALRLLRRTLIQPDSPPHLPKDLATLATNLAAPALALPDPAKHPIRPKFLGIIPTRACNNRCRYCDFGASAGPHQTMDLGLAGAAVTWYVDFLNRARLELLEVHFFGGEPLLAREVVETVIHRGRLLADRYGLYSHFEVSTNGVFESDYAVFVGDYFDAVVLSFDGFREIHDRHRPMDHRRGSFEAVLKTARLLSASPTELCLRCCVSSENVERLAEIAVWFCREFQPAAVNFEPLSATPESLAAGLEVPDPYAFARHFSLAKKVLIEHGVKPVYAATEGEGSRTSFCPVGNDTLIVSPDGRISSCYLPQKKWQEHNLDMDVGRITQDGRVVIDDKSILRLRQLVEVKPRCANCFCRWSCAGGCHVSHTYPGSSLSYDKFCLQTRILTACKLLEEMGQRDRAEKLLADQQAMESLACQKSDRIVEV